MLTDKIQQIINNPSDYLEKIVKLDKLFNYIPKTDLESITRVLSVQNVLDSKWQNGVNFTSEEKALLIYKFYSEKLQSENVAQRIKQIRQENCDEHNPVKSYIS